jgi:AP-1 complex subunit gamma-1
MSVKLRDLIRTVRACKTAAEERAVITKESALIRTAFKDESTEFRHRNVAKLLYIHMLGYPTHFGQIECIKLLASGKFNEKRIGYLALMLLLDERQEVLTLVTNSLQMDLCHANHFVAGLALTALGNIGSAEMARDLARDVDNLLKSPLPYVRKKAALCTIRLLTRVPDLIDTFLPNVVVLLTDKNHNVLLTGVSLVTAVVEIEPAYVEKFTRLVRAGGRRGRGGGCVARLPCWRQRCITADMAGPTARDRVPHPTSLPRRRVAYPL